MYKRGQIAVFLVIGILVLGLFAGIFFIVKESREGELRDQTGISDSGDFGPQLKSYVEACMRETLKKALVVAGKNGGNVFATSAPTFVTEREVLAYGFYRDKVQLDPKFTAEQIAFFIDLNIPKCTGDFSSFKKKGITIEQEEVDRAISEFATNVNFGSFVSSTEVTIIRDGVVVRTRYPLSAERGSDTRKLESFEIRFASPLGNALEDGTSIIEHYRLENLIDLEYVSLFDPYITIVPYDSSTFVVGMDYGEESIPQKFFFVVENGVKTS